MNASGTGEKGALTSSRLGATDTSNLNGDGGVCVCVHMLAYLHVCAYMCMYARVCVHERVRA